MAAHFSDLLIAPGARWVPQLAHHPQRLVAPVVLHSLWAQYSLVDPAVDQASMRLLFESSPLAP
ncbi:Uncharacterised protein [Vibrio cholerae]|nr:Uncharacterised protein [Vibrio cholerae]